MENIIHFHTAVRKTCYAAIRDLTPLEVSVGLESISNQLKQTDKEIMRKNFDKCEEQAPFPYHSYMDFYLFLERFYTDMYENPEAYTPFNGKLEEFLAGRKLNGMKQKEPGKTKKLLSYTRNTVAGYQLLLCMLGVEGRLMDVGAFEGNSVKTLFLSAESYSVIAKHVNSGVSPISIEDRLKALERVGLVCRNKGDEYYLQSFFYPQMFEAMCALAMKTGGKYSGFPFFHFSNAEFRGLDKKFKPTFEDYYRPLVPERLAIVSQIHRKAMACHCKPTIHTFWKVDYKYQGAQVMCVDSFEGDLIIRIVGNYNWEDQSQINSILAAEPEAFQKYTLRHVWRCTACSTSHLGMFVTVLGKKQRVCGGAMIGFSWQNPTEEDIAYIARYIEFRCQIIENEKK